MIARWVGREASPAAIRVGPFFVFILLTSLQGWGGPAGKYWLYFSKTVIAAAMLWLARRQIGELDWRFSWEGFGAGLLIFVLWVGLDGLYPTVDQMFAALSRTFGGAHSNAVRTAGWNPFEYFGPSRAAWFFLAIRWGGSTVVVPPLEEVFYRSFLYRFWQSNSFESVPLNCFRWAPFLGVAVIFGCTHQQWLAGILCGLILQGLAVWKNRLSDALTAHAAANFLLAAWVWWRGAWHFW